MTVREAASELDITEKSVMRLIREGVLYATLTREGWTVKGADVRARMRQLAGRPPRLSDLITREMAKRRVSR
jgi:excisionase family DNA binding protein